MSSVAYLCLWLFTFTIPWENSVVLPGIGTISKLLVFVTAAVGLLAILARGRVRPPATFHLLAASFAIWVGLSSAWSTDPRESVNRFMILAGLATIPWLVWELVVTQSRRRNLLQAYVLGAYISACYILLNYSAGVSTTGSTGEVSQEVTGRYSVEGFNPNSLGFLLVLAIPIAWHLGLTHRNPILRWVNRLYMPIGTLATLLTGSRGALVVLAVALLIVPATLGRLSIGLKVAVLTVITASVVAAGIFVPPVTWARLATTADEIESGSLNERRVIWEAGLELFPRHPIGGVGAGGFPQAVRPFLGYKGMAHNTFLSVLLEEGIVGLTLFVLMFVSIYFHARSAPPEERRFVLILLLVFTIGLLPRNWEFDKPTWLMFALLLAPVSAPTFVRQATGWVPARTRPPPRVEPVGRESVHRHRGP
jgi:O-antigen ligase